MIRFCVLAFSFFLMTAIPSATRAEMAYPVDAAPTRDSLVTYWESWMRANPSVKSFTATDEKDVYNFESALFPYKGRLHLLNAAVTKMSGRYYGGGYNGIIEFNLDDAADDFFEKYAASYGAFKDQNYFYYAPGKTGWFDAADWDAHSDEFYKKDDDKAINWAKLLSDWAPIIVFVAVLVLLLWRARKQTKRAWDYNDKAMERSERGMQIAEESLKHQLEHTQLLKQILAEVSKK